MQAVSIVNFLLALGLQLRLSNPPPRFLKLEEAPALYEHSVVQCKFNLFTLRPRTVNDVAWKANIKGYQ